MERHQLILQYSQRINQLKMDLAGVNETIVARKDKIE
jgi:hypothetical protein